MRTVLSDGGSNGMEDLLEIFVQTKSIRNIV